MPDRIPAIAAPARRRARTADERIADLVEQITTARHLCQNAREQADQASGNRREHLLMREKGYALAESKAFGRLAEIAPRHSMITE